jgi:two-component system, cell cycle sensor histidine kinase and response regulator CckA
VQEMQGRTAALEALRSSDEMLRHSQKLEAVGRLAGGVAHDFNNLLTAIIGYASLLRARFAGDSAAREQADLIHQAGEQAAGLTRQLLAFSRKQILQPKLIDLNAVVCNLQRLLQRIIGEHIEISTEPRALAGCVLADPGQVEQVVVNLGVNARDAMPGGGRLTSRTVDAEILGATPELDLAAGHYIAIEVTDTGEGMDPETKSRIFEPFFTTKGPGKGTGLGLATVYGIVKQSGGAIGVESERGRGTTFRIYFPRQEGVAEVMETAPVHVAKVTATETILVVEDEEIVRELVCEVLSAEGYRVSGTDRGSEALRMVREELTSVDLLISDVVMPEMNGAEVARRVREASPRVKVLFVSGYSEKDMADQGLGTLAFEVLQKPFTPTGLTKKVRQILDEAAR